MICEQDDVEQFMRAAGQELPETPTIPSFEVRKLRAKLILEETLETIKGLGVAVSVTDGELDIDDCIFDDYGNASLIEIADGCADIIVVTLGCASACGIALEPVFQEVHESNMSKFIDGHRREDGKWIKGPSYKPANIKAVLEAQK